MECLLVKTKDKRKFLTEEGNLSMLKEFSETFKAEVLLVKTDSSQEILPLKKLAPAFCDSSYDSKPEYEMISKILPKRTRKSILKNASLIQKFIKKQLLDGKIVSLKNLKKKYKENYGVTDACLCNHLSAVRKELENEGHKVTKTGAGSYQLN